MKEKATALMSVTYKEEAQTKIKETRETFIEVTTFIMENMKDSREKSLTLTKLEEACMWAIKGITREDNNDSTIPTIPVDSLISAINKTNNQSMNKMSIY